MQQGWNKANLKAGKNASKSKHRKFFSAHKRTQIVASTMFVLNKISVWGLHSQKEQYKNENLVHSQSWPIIFILDLQFAIITTITRFASFANFTIFMIMNFHWMGYLHYPHYFHKLHTPLWPFGDWMKICTYLDWPEWSSAESRWPSLVRVLHLLTVKASSCLF